MRRGFTILELLVASLLLGMLVTILTTIFNQSSIAWRTGVAGVSAMDEVRDNIAEVREEADNIVISGDLVGRIVSPWDKNGNLRDRAVSVNGQEDQAEDKIVILSGKVTPTSQGRDFTIVAVGSGESGRTLKTYTVGVMSRGPNPDPNVDYDDITSWPDEIE